MKDLKLAESLGMKPNRLRHIRTLIKKNMAEIQLHGSLCTKSTMIRVGKGAEREITEYWLTEPQAYVVCRHSNAPNAPAVNKMLIEVFTPASAAMAASGESGRRR